LRVLRICLENPSPKKEVHVRSPILYKDGILAPPQGLINKEGISQQPLTRQYASSMDVKGEKTPQRNPLVKIGDNPLATDVNFYTGMNDHGLKTAKHKRYNPELANVLNDLMRQSMGSFHKDGTDRFIDDFLKPDVAI
jgi:hypothetical protein